MAEVFISYKSERLNAASHLAKYSNAMATPSGLTTAL